jgi:predicted N-acetyltransferase YhbS
MSLLIRPALPSEIETVRDIERASAQRFVGMMDALAADEPSSPETLAARIEAGGLLVAETEGATVAFVMFRPLGDSLYIEQIDVLPAYAGRRLGAALLDAVAERAATLTLSTFRDIPWNAPWYRRLGFVDLDDSKLTPDLREIRRQHIARGLDESRRVFRERRV